MQDVKTSDQVPDLFELLSDACNVLTIMGEGSIFSLITWYVEEMFDTFKFDPRAVFENIEVFIIIIFYKYFSLVFRGGKRQPCYMRSIGRLFFLVLGVFYVSYILILPRKVSEQTIFVCF